MTLASGISVAPIMATRFSTTAPDTNIATLVRDVMLSSVQRAVPVVSGKDFLGLVTGEGVQKVDHSLWATTPAERVMVPAAAIPRLESTDDLMLALQRFGDAEVLPVVSDGRLVGLLDRRSIANYIRLRDMVTTERG